MATKTKRRREAKGGKPRYGTSAYFSYIGKKGARKANRGKAKRRKVRRRFYPSFTYKRGPNKGKHYRPIALKKYSRSRKARNRVRHPSVKWSGRKGTRRYSYTTIGRGENRKGYFTNPRRRSRRNPAKAKGIAALPGQYLGGFTGSLQRIPTLFKGKKAAKNIAFTAGGAVATYIAGGYVAKFLNPVLDRVPGLNTDMGKRIVGGMMPFTAAFAITRFVKDRDIKDALMIGGALGSLVELLMPGRIGSLITQIPGVDRIAVQEAVTTGTSGLAGPVAGLGAYVGAPAYQGVAGYVAAPGYQGAGDGMSGYVAAPGYQGAGDGMGQMPVLADDMLAGFSDDNQPVAASSFLEQSFLAN